MVKMRYKNINVYPEVGIHEFAGDVVSQCSGEAFVCN